MSGPEAADDPTPAQAQPEAPVEQLIEVALAAFASSTSVAELKAARILHTGDRSPLALANRAIGGLPKAERKEAGLQIGRARARVNQALAAREAELSAAELSRALEAEKVDVTLPTSLAPVGAPHPITALADELADVFVALGWEVVEGPEVESEWLNFDALNLHPDHPARTTQDTLFVDPLEDHLVLRTHTSPVQARTMLTRTPPIYIICPGKVYRADEFDATHLPMFHQIEGLVIDKGIGLAHLRGTLDHLARAVFGDIRIRMRPNYFPFTAPSAEVDLECFVCRGASVGHPERPCRTCSSEGWIEWGGCGVVNPRVLIACGIDPEVYSGFAFGMGIDRTLMFRNNLEDLRDVIEGDVRFSRSLEGLAR